MLFIASSLQQIGLQYTQAGKAGFITSMYIVLIPIYRLFFGKRTNVRAWFAIAMSVIGLYLLSVKEASFMMQKGDFLVFAGAFFWAGQILCCDIFTVNSDPLKLSCIQFASTALMSIVAMLLFETPSVAAVTKSILPLTYVGLFSTAIAFTLQMVGQKGNDPVNASLIFCLESIFAVLSGYFVLREVLTLREIIGCAILFFAIVTVQLPDKNKKSLSA
jgi:drug/metabolite transporter (DMT)-like permease